MEYLFFIKDRYNYSEKEIMEEAFEEANSEFGRLGLDSKPHLILLSKSKEGDEIIYNFSATDKSSSESSNQNGKNDNYQKATNSKRFIASPTQ